MVVGRDGTPGSAGLHLAAGVPLLHPGEQVFAAMLDGWRAQQLARNLAAATAGRREAMVRAFAAHADAFPWQWGPHMLDEWLGERPRRFRTAETVFSKPLPAMPGTRCGPPAEAGTRLPSEDASDCNAVRCSAQYHAWPFRGSDRLCGTRALS